MSTPSSASASPPRRSTAQHDEDLLRRIGVQPVLARRMTGFGNFAISFSIISILSGCMTLFGYGMGTGGPAVMIWGWIGVGALVRPAHVALLVREVAVQRNVVEHVDFAHRVSSRELLFTLYTKRVAADRQVGLARVARGLSSSGLDD